MSQHLSRTVITDRLVAQWQGFLFQEICDFLLDSVSVLEIKLEVNFIKLLSILNLILQFLSKGNRAKSRIRRLSSFPQPFITICTQIIFTNLSSNKNAIRSLTASRGGWGGVEVECIPRGVCIPRMHLRPVDRILVTRL